MNENIKIFDTFSTSIFQKLYKNFPLCIVIVPSDEIKEFKEFKTSCDDLEIIFSESMYWLQSNDFIKFSYPKERVETPVAISEFNCVELTLKGLNILKSPTPQTLHNKRTLGEDILDKFKKGLIQEASKLTISAIIGVK